MKNYYKILELDTNKVTLDEIKIAYRTVAKKYHPDVNIGDKLAEERIKDINEAYRVLTNPQTKRKYDRIWNANANRKKRAFNKEGEQSKTALSNFFYMFFGDVEENQPIKKAKEVPVKGENIETSINIDLAEAFYGTKKNVTLKTLNGNPKTVLVPVPEGIRNGDKVRIVGQGKEGKNGGKNGDLFIKININNRSKFRVHGYDLHTDLLLTPWEAALGTRVKVKSIDDEATIYIPQGIQTGEKIKIPGKGYKKKQGERGDLIVEIKVTVPKKLTQKEKELFEKLNEISNFNPRNTREKGKNDVKMVDKKQAI